MKGKKLSYTTLKLIGFMFFSLSLAMLSYVSKDALALTPTPLPPNTTITATFTPTARPNSCKVVFKTPSTWNGGFTADVTIINTRSAPIQEWQLVWNFNNGATVRDAWNAQVRQTNTTVTAQNSAAWNSTIAANGGSVNFGFNGNGTAMIPEAFSLNGVPCGDTPQADLVIPTAWVDVIRPACSSELGINVGRVMVLNQGNVAAGSFVVAFGGQSQTVTGLGAGQTTSLMFYGIVLTPAPVVDVNNQVAESNENNNIFTGPMGVPTPTSTAMPTTVPAGVPTATPTRPCGPTPTFTPTPTDTPPVSRDSELELTVSATTVAVGETFTLSPVMVNHGTCRLAVMDFIIQADAPLLTPTTIFKAQGTSFIFTATQAGSTQLQVTAEGEWNCNGGWVGFQNMTMKSPLITILGPTPTDTPTPTLTPTPDIAPKADLIINSVFVSSDFESGGPACWPDGKIVNVGHVTLVNQGNAAAGSFTVSFGGKTQTVSGLDAGQTLSVNLIGASASPAPMVDSNNDIVESNEDNNTFTGPIMIAMPVPPLCTPTVTPTPTDTPTLTPTPTDTPTPTATATRPVSTCKVDYKLVNSWDNGLTGNFEVTISNLSDNPIQGWRLGWDSETAHDKIAMTNIWGAVKVAESDYTIVKNEAWNSTIAAKGNVSFGMTLHAVQGAFFTPQGFILNDTVCQ